MPFFSRSGPPPAALARIRCRRHLLGRLYPILHPDRNRRRLGIDDICLGYSGLSHRRFFREIAACPTIRKVCVLGVYYGRDVAYLSQAWRDLGREGVSVTAIDKFNDQFCDDWPETKRGLDWVQAGFGPAPSIAAAASNLRALSLLDGVTLHCSRDDEFLSRTAERFDFIYIDTAHDYESVRTLIRLARNRLNSGGLLGGDDFSNGGTWGVERAVLEAFTKIEIVDRWIWMARDEDFRYPPVSNS